MRGLLLALAGLFLGRAVKAEERPRIPPVAGGVLVIGTSTASAEDLRYGALAAGFARAGHESFVAYDMTRPPINAARRLVRARRFLDDARRYRRHRDLRRAVDAADKAIRIFERSANEPQHLSLLVEALVERGATAHQLGDTAKAETVFLEAIALSPLHQLDEVLYDPPTRRLFGDVRRASRQLRYGSIRIEVVDVKNAVVSVDFSSPRGAPYTTKLTDGRHFVTVTAPGRYEVVRFVPVRAGRQTDVSIRPPLSGDGRTRTEAIEGFSPEEPASLVALAAAAGLRFVAVADPSRSNVGVSLFDGRTGGPVTGGVATLSPNPSPPEVDAAVAQLVKAAIEHDPSIEDHLVQDGSWYTSWWAFSLLGIAVAGAATATALVLTSNREIEYRFEP